MSSITLTSSYSPDQLMQKMHRNATKAVNEHLAEMPIFLSRHHRVCHQDEQLAAIAAAGPAIPQFEALGNNATPLTFSFSKATGQGRKKEMQDAHFSCENDRGIALGVFDGHCYDCVSKHAATWFHQHFFEKLAEAEGNVHQTFTTMINEVHAYVKNNELKGGATAVITYIDRQTNLVYTATLGDSEAFIFREINGKRQAIPLSCVRTWSSPKDARRLVNITIKKGATEEEIEDEVQLRIEADPKGLRLFQQLPDKQGRRGYGLNTARAIGDVNHCLLSHYKGTRARLPGIIQKPKISVNQVLPGDRLMLCSDGVTDYAAPGDIIKKLWPPHPNTPPAEAIVDLALFRKTVDDVTVLLVDVSGGWRSERSVLDEMRTHALNAIAQHRDPVNLTLFVKERNGKHNASLTLGELQEALALPNTHALPLFKNIPGEPRNDLIDFSIKVASDKGEQKQLFEASSCSVEWDVGAVFGVFGGFLGDAASKYASNWLSKRFMHELAKHKDDVYQTFTSMVRQMHEGFIKYEYKHSAGSTMVVSYVDQRTGRIYTATLGDVEAFLYREIGGKMRAIPLSDVQNWHTPEDAQRLAITQIDPDCYADYQNALQQRVTKNQRTSPRHLSLNNGPRNLHVSRAIGALDLCNVPNPGSSDDMVTGITQTPKISINEVQLGDYLMLCSTGVTGHMSQKDVIEVLNQKGDDPAQAIVNSAKEHGSRDNITAMVIQITEEADSSGDESNDSDESSSS